MKKPKTIREAAPAFGIWKDNPVDPFDPTRPAANPNEEAEAEWKAVCARAGFVPNEKDTFVKAAKHYFFSGYYAARGWPRSAANPEEAFQQVVRDIHSNTRDLTEEQYLDVLRRTIRYLQGIERAKE